MFKMKYFHSRLLGENICSEKNIPSISSINRIIRDKAILNRRSTDSFDVSSLSDNEIVNVSY